jgi:hypothetical protein
MKVTSALLVKRKEETMQTSAPPVITVRQAPLL